MGCFLFCWQCLLTYKITYSSWIPVHFFSRYLYFTCYNQEIIAKSNTMMLLSYVFLSNVYSLRSIFEFFFKCRIGSNFILLVVDTQVWQHHLFRRLSFLYWMILASLSKVIWLCTWSFISGFPILFHWYICLWEGTL